MVKPVIMTVDDEPQVLNAVARDLQARYGTDYRVVKAGSGKEALEAVEELERRNTPVALFVVDQRMPGMTGTEFLTEAISHFPDAKRVLLTAYADTDAAIVIENVLRREGMEIITGTRLLEAGRTAGGRKFVEFEHAGRSRRVPRHAERGAGGRAWLPHPVPGR